MDKPRPPVWLLAAAVIVQSTLFGLFLRNPSNSVKLDSQVYLKLAQNLRDHHVFSKADAPPYEPDVYRLPGYPFVLALFHATSPETITAAIALQCLLGILIVWLVWPVFYHYGGVRGAWAGTVFLCFDLVILMHQNLLMTEALYTFVFTLALCQALRYHALPQLKNAAATGFSFGAATLIKPIAVAAAGMFLICSYKNWKKTFWLGLFILLLPGCWVIRNWVATGYPVYTIQGNFVLLQYPAARVMAAQTGRTRTEVLGDLEAELKQQGFDERSNNVALSFAYKRLAFQVIRRYPLETIRYVAIGILRTLSGTGLEMIVDLVSKNSSPENRPIGSELRMTGFGMQSLLKAYPILIPLQIAYGLFLIGGYLFFLKGMLELWLKKEFRLVGFILFSILSILLISTLPGAYYRLRIPIVPLVALGIAAAFPPPTRHDKML